MRRQPDRPQEIQINLAIDEASKAKNRGAE
jgi:hypothetical protein